MGTGRMIRPFDKALWRWTQWRFQRREPQDRRDLREKLSAASKGHRRTAELRKSLSDKLHTSLRKEVGRHG